MGKLAYRIHLEPEPEGGFTVTVPSLPGCVTWGEDYDQALAMAREAIELYLEVLVEDGKPIPQDPIIDPVDTYLQIESPAVA
jgi:antitoxin HicB